MKTLTLAVMATTALAAATAYVFTLPSGLAVLIVGWLVSVATLDD